MLKKIFPLLIVVIISLLISGCENKKGNSSQSLDNIERQFGKSHSSDQKSYRSDAKIIIYGRPSCSRCVNIMKELDDRNLVYNFFNVDDNELENREMWNLVNKYRLQKNNSVGFPVVKINIGSREYGYSNPAFYEIEEILQ